MQKHTLPFIVFLSGAVVMILELTGSRVLAPYLGASIFVWTSLIGIILGSLSAGYYLGGKLSDKNPNYKKLSIILLLSAIAISLTILIKEPVLQLLDKSIKDIRIGSIVAAIVLFTPASILLGMVSPYAIRLRMKDLSTSGRTIGNLYALSTIGSIVGTFASGFFLISLFGHTQLIILLAIVMAINSILIALNHLSILKFTILGIFVFQLAFAYTAQAQAREQGFIDIDTNYSRVQIFDTTDFYTNEPIRKLSISKDSSSAMFLANDDLVFPYTKYYDLAAHFKPNFAKTLLIGGGAYSYPKYFLTKFPEATMDVIEIDPQLTELAKEYFNLKDDPRLKIFHEDGRIFLNRNTEKYDVIFGDAFKTFYSIPHQLATIEAMQKISDSLTEDGIFLANVIGPLEGDGNEFIKAAYKTFKEVFPQVYILPVQAPSRGDITQNNLFVALKSTEEPSWTNPDLEYQLYLSHLWKKEIPSDIPILTDEFAPVDQYIMKLLK